MSTNDNKGKKLLNQKLLAIIIGQLQLDKNCVPVIEAILFLSAIWMNKRLLQTHHFCFLHVQFFKK